MKQVSLVVLLAAIANLALAVNTPKLTGEVKPVLAKVTVVNKTNWVVTVNPNGGLRYKPIFAGQSQTYELSNWNTIGTTNPESVGVSVNSLDLVVYDSSSTPQNQGYVGLSNSWAFASGIATNVSINCVLKGKSSASDVIIQITPPSGGTQTLFCKNDQSITITMLGSY